MSEVERIRLSEVDALSYVGSMWPINRDLRFCNADPAAVF